MNEHTIEQKIAYGEIVEKLLKNGDAYHDGLFFELVKPEPNRTFCQVTKSGEVIATLSTTKELWGYC